MSTKVNWIKPLILAVVLVALGGIAYWTEFSHKPNKEAQEEQSKKVFELKDRPVQSVRIAGTAATLELACSDLAQKLCKPGDHSKWELKEPLKAKADETNANGLLSNLNHLNATETISLAEDTPQKRQALLKEYGLDAAARAGARKVTVVAGEPAKSTTLYLGATHPIGEGIFALVEKDGQVNENTVYLLPSHFKANFEHELTHWRNKKLLTVDSHQITGFELKSKITHLKGVKQDALWTLKNLQGKAPEEFAGDLENIEAMLSGAVFLTAKEFVSDNKSDAKAKAALRGTKPYLTLTLQPDKGSAQETPAPITLQLFNGPLPKSQDRTPKAPFGRLLATVSTLDPLFELEPTSKDRLDKQLKDLRLSKLITTMDRYAAKRLEFSGKPIGDQPLVVTQVDGKWVFADKTDADNEKVQGTLDRLSGNRVKEFLSGKKIPAGQDGGIVLTLGDDQNAAKRKFAFWKHDGKLYARDLLSKRDEAFLVDTAVQEGLPWSATYFQKSTAPSPAPAKK